MNPNSLLPLGPNGQLLDPISFLFYLLVLPIRIVTEFANQAATLPAPAAAFPRLPSLVPEQTPLKEEKVIEAPAYTVMPAAAPMAAAAAPTAAAATYENEERCEVVWNDDGLPVEIIIHRRATRT